MVNIDKIWNFITWFSPILSSFFFPSFFSFISIISFCSWNSTILSIFFNILFTNDSFLINFEVQFNFFSVDILLNLQNLSSNTRLFTNLIFKSILYKFGSSIIFINSSLVALSIKLSGYLIDDNNFHISSFIKLSSWFNKSNNKFILSSSRAIM